MTGIPDAPAPLPPSGDDAKDAVRTASEASQAAASAAKAEKKKKNKARAAWISFAGRIVAQIVGAVASIVLGVLVLQKYQATDSAAVAPAPAPRDTSVARVKAASSDGRISIAVLPLDNFSRDEQQEYFADGMTEAIIADLAQIDGLRVISRTSSMAYKDHKKSLPEVAGELGVDLVVEGSVLTVGDRVRVTAQLIEARTDEHLWAQSYERTLRDVLSLQAEIATAIANSLKVAVTPRQQGRLASRRPVDPAVYDLYLRGRHAWNLRTPAGFQEALRYFQEAVQKDPEFALGYAGIADVYSISGTSGPGSNDPRGAQLEGKAAAERAIALDGGLAEAHTSLAAVYLFRERKAQDAEREFKRALDLNPGYPTAHQWFAILLSEQGRHAEATSHAQQAVTLDPLSGAMHQTLGLTQYYARRYDRAITEQRRALELAPQLPLARSILARSLLLQGDAAAALSAIESAPQPRSPDLLVVEALASMRAGDRARAEAVVKELKGRKPPAANALMQWYASTGDQQAAFEILEELLKDQRIGSTLKVDPMFDGIRSDARFAEALKRAGLE